MIWNFIATLVISYVISAALAPKPKSPKAAALADFDLPTAEVDRPIPVIFGTVWVTGPNVLWYGHLKASRGDDGSAIKVITG